MKKNTAVILSVIIVIIFSVSILIYFTLNSKTTDDIQEMEQNYQEIEKPEVLQNYNQIYVKIGEGINDYAFFDKETGTILQAKESIVIADIPEEIDGVEVKAIADMAFYCNYDLIEVNIPKTVTSIGELAFSTCVNLEKIIIPDSINQIGEMAFYSCYNLKNIRLPKNLDKIETGLFGFCDAVENIIIPKTLKEIDESAFYYCNNLTNIYYEGSKSDFEKIEIDLKMNESLYDAEIEYNYIYEEYEETDTNQQIEDDNDEYDISKEQEFDEEITDDADEEKQENTSSEDIVIDYANMQKIFVNEQEFNISCYTSYGKIYVKLRDVAKALNGTANNFEVQWDNDKERIQILSNVTYTSIGGEFESNFISQDVKITTSPIYIDGEEVRLNGYNINSVNYFMLNDIAKALNFSVEWDSINKTPKITTQ